MLIIDRGEFGACGRLTHLIGRGGRQQAGKHGGGAAQGEERPLRFAHPVLPATEIGIDDDAQQRHGLGGQHSAQPARSFKPHRDDGGVGDCLVEVAGDPYGGRDGSFPGGEDRGGGLRPGVAAGPFCGRVEVAGHRDAERAQVMKAMESASALRIPVHATPDVVAPGA